MSLKTESFTLTNLLIGSALLGGNIAGDVIGGILGDRTDDFCCRAYQPIYIAGRWITIFKRVIGDEC
jgi:hypothetical protein